MDNSGSLQPKHKSGLAVSLCPDVIREVLKRGGPVLECNFTVRRINWLLFWASQSHH